MQSGIQTWVSQSQVAWSQAAQSPVPQPPVPQSRTPQLKIMKAAVYQESGTITLEDRPVPRLKDPQDTIIKVVLTTICPSGIYIKHGTVPKAMLGTILGHESVGIVEQTGGAVRRLKPGDRVAVNVEIFCGEYHFYRRGYVNGCTHEHGGWAPGCRIGSGQAGYVRAPSVDDGLTGIPGEVTNEAALFTGDILSTGHWGASLAEIKPADTVAVTDAGPTGLCILMCAKPYGPGTVIAIDISNRRLELTRKQGLVNVILNPFEQDVEQGIRNLTLGCDADTVLEMAGGRDTFQMAWKIARPNAVTCVVALYEEPQMLPLPGTYGKNLVFKTGGVDASCCEEIMKLIKARKPDTSCLITHRAKFEDTIGTYDVLEDGRNHVIKYAAEVL